MPSLRTILFYVIAYRFRNSYYKTKNKKQKQKQKQKQNQNKNKTKQNKTKQNKTKQNKHKNKNRLFHVMFSYSVSFFDCSAIT